MKTYRIGVIGLGQRIAHVLRAMDEVGWTLNVAGYVDPRPVGLPILAERDIAPGKSYDSVAALLKDGPFDLVMIGSPNHLHFEHLLAAFNDGKADAVLAASIFHFREYSIRKAKEYLLSKNILMRN